MTRDDPETYCFVPGHLAAVCADCGGYFVSAALACPGCGSKHWTIAGENAATATARQTRIDALDRAAQVLETDRF